MYIYMHERERREGGESTHFKNANLSSFNAPIGFVKSLKVSGFVKSNNNNNNNNKLIIKGHHHSLPKVELV